jgi:hypothetical protein
VSRTFALIAPVSPVIDQVSCSSEMVPTAPKQKEMQKSMSLGSKDVGREHSLQKFLTRLRATNFCINYTISARFMSSFVQ